MKQIIIFSAILFTLSITSCRKEETCATYSKDTKEVKSESNTENI